MSDDTQRECVPTIVGNSYIYIGTVVGGNTQKGWDVTFDLFIKDNKIVKHIYRNKLIVFKKNE